MDIRIYPYDPHGRPFAQVLQQKAKRLQVELHVRADRIYDIVSGSIDKPIVVRFLEPSQPVSEDEDAEIRAFCEAGGMVFPVAETAPDAGKALNPDRNNSRYAGRLNAFLRAPVGQGWISALLDEILAYGWLRRRIRKVFISYKRTDSAAVAQQLFREFSHRNYIVFLDEVSIDHGDDFQSELLWWLNDADLVLILASPNLDQSKWVLEEINFARTHHIGSLVVVWPRDAIAWDPAHNPMPQVVDTAASNLKLQLEPTDFTEIAGNTAPGMSRELTPDALSRVCARAFEERAEGIHYRLNNLVVTTRRHIENNRLKVHSTRLGDLTYVDEQQRTHFLRVLPFRPDAQSLWDLACDATNAEFVKGVYAEIAPGDRRAEGLAWIATAVRTAPRCLGEAPQLNMQLVRLPQDKP